MNSFWTFATEQPLAGTIIVLAALFAATTPFSYAFKAYNRKKRSENIALHGWPTAPIDADGDIIYRDNTVEPF